MFTLEERQRTVDLFIKSGQKENIVIQQLGYPSLGCLWNCYKEFIETGKLHEKSKLNSRFTEEEIAYAIEYALNEDLSESMTKILLMQPPNLLVNHFIDMAIQCYG